jgi:hypothetical protein
MCISALTCLSVCAFVCENRYWPEYLICEEQFLVYVLTPYTFKWAVVTFSFKRTSPIVSAWIAWRLYGHMITSRKLRRSGHQGRRYSEIDREGLHMGTSRLCSPGCKGIHMLPQPTKSFTFASAKGLDHISHTKTGQPSVLVVSYWISKGWLNTVSPLTAVSDTWVSPKSLPFRSSHAWLPGTIAYCLHVDSVLYK